MAIVLEEPQVGAQVFKTRVATMEELPIQEGYLITFRGELTLADYQEVYPRALDIVVDTGWKKLVFNMLEMTKDDMQGRAWYLRQHLPEVFRKVGDGFRCGVIQPTSSFQRFALGLVIKGIRATGKKIEIKFFDTEQEAVDWI
ncbi:MAG: hypothetical protein AAFQ98_01970 [Bacteroidota bacterium]